MPLFNKNKHHGSAVSIKPGRDLSAISKALESQKEKKEKKVQSVTNQRDEMEREILSILDSIDFSHFPREMLMPKPGHRLPQIMEDRDMIKSLLRSKEEYPVDTKALDESLKNLALKLKNAIELGEKITTEAALTGMVKCLREVRNVIPKVDKDSVVSFTKKGVEYTESWISLSNLCIACEQEKRGLSEKKNDIERLRTEKKRISDMIDKKINEQPDYREAIQTMMERVSATTDKEKEARQDFIDRKLCSARLDIKNYEYDLLMLNIKNKEYQARTMYDSIFSVPITDSEKNEQDFRHAIDNMFANFSKMDEELKRTDLTLNEIASRVKDLQNSEGNIAVSNTAIESVYDFMDDKKNLQTLELKNNARSAKEFWDVYGVRSEEEQAEAVKQMKEHEKYMNDVREENHVYEEESIDEDDTIYN